MGERVIDPDKVIEMGKATVKASIEIEAMGRAARTVIDDVDHLVGGAPDAFGRAQKVAGELAERAGEAHARAVRFIDDVKALEELGTWQFWLPNPGNLTDPDKMKVVTSDEFGGGVIGVSGFLMSKYGRGATLYQPGPGSAIPVIPRLDRMPPAGGQVTFGGRTWVPGAGGLLVPAGTPGVDPRFPNLSPAIAEDWKTTHPGRGLRPVPVNPPRWAVVGSNTLGWVGAGLTVVGAGYNQWQQDAKYHPEMSEGERFARAAGNAATEGAMSAGGAIAGAWAGAKGGAIVGAAVGSIFPGPGTAIGGVVGGLIGGLAGGFAGGKVGAAAGRGFKAFVKGFFG